VLKTQKKQTFEWFSYFKHRETSAGNCEHSRHPYIGHTAENLEEVSSTKTMEYYFRYQ